MDVQNLEKNQRNKIIKELCDQGAGFSQLARITSISYGIIQRVVTDQSPLIYTGILRSKLPLPPFDPRLYGAEGGGFDVKDLGDSIVVVV